MKILLSGGQFGGTFVQWQLQTKVVSLLHEKVYWNYDREIHKDNNLRADFCGVTTKETGPIVTVLLE